MRLNVLSVAYPFTAVGDDAVGGSEQVLTQLDRKLTQHGHRSWVLAAEGSQVSGSLIPTPRWEGPLNDEARRWGAARHLEVLERCCRELPIDLIHMHSLDFWQYLPSLPVPTLATLHLPPEWYPDDVFQPARPLTWLNCVSESQRRGCRGRGAGLPVCPNGIDTARFRHPAAKKTYLLSLGRVCPEKGFHVALDAARRAGRPLFLAGEVKPLRHHERYFHKEIVPRLDSCRRFIGPVGLRRKRRLLAGASCLLIPSLVAETSSLVAMEALASGTPVVAFANGALPEIVDHGRTGFLVRGLDEMTEAILACRSLDPDECRAEARRRFSAEAMYRRYLALYAALLRGEIFEGAAAEASPQPFPIPRWQPHRLE